MGGRVPMISDLTIASAGAVVFGYVIVALFFWRFWRQTRVRLFAAFAAAFVILAVERAAILTAVADPIEEPMVFLTRLIAFGVIIWGIWDANRSKP
jgi:hypothetical protein